MDQDEKLRQRQEKLSRWKRSKQNAEPSKDDALAQRRKKLQEWKQKKQQADLAKQAVTPKNVGMTSASIVSKKTKKSAKRRSLFDESDDEIEDESSVKKLYKPSPAEDSATFEHRNGDNNVLTEQSDEDPVEEYIRQLTAKESVKTALTPRASDTPEKIVDDDDFESEYAHDTENPVIGSTWSKNKKRIAPVDYTKVDGLIPLNKCLYTESSELKVMSDDDVKQLRMSLDNIKILGIDCPKPVTKWSQLGLSSDIMDLISNELQFVTLTPIQSQAIPAIMSGRDVIGISKTGSGKTVAFLLPLIRQIKAQPSLAPGESGPIGVILTPTRELAVQIQEEVLNFCAGTKITSLCCVGGSELKKQINDLKRGVDIIVATPGRFIDLMTLNSGNLLSPTRISFVVMDEADRLFDLGFGPQVTQIMNCIRPDRQCVLFSATFPNKLRHFASKTLTNPIQISINSKLLINNNIKQLVQIFDEKHVKFEFLLKRLGERLAFHRDEDEKTIIFVASQTLCDLLYEELLINGISTFAIHAGKPSAERLENLQKFKETPNGILICTEVLSRGLNVPEVSLVIIYNAAKTVAQYVHTAGRTGRGTNTGTALSFLMVDELSSAYILVKCMKDEELSSLPMDVYHKLKEMNDEFARGLKTGEYRLIQGFGGKGLDHFDEVNDAKQTEEWKGYGLDPNEEEPDTERGIITKMDYKRGKRTEGNSVTYYASININDLPQLARWEATKTETISTVKRETGCNFENKGRFYPEGQGPKLDTDEPKLCLIVEAPVEDDVTLALELLESKVKEGVQKAALMDMQGGKYKL